MGTMTTTVLRTKLHPPVMPADLVPRPAVDERLDRGLRERVSLVSAGAGYGKSTTVAHWLASRAEPAAWVSLDEVDSDLRVFLEYVVAAVRTAYPEACPETNSLVQAATLPPTAVLAESLVNELDALDEPLILVLDDYHHITVPAVHELVAEVLRHPPLLFHLVLVTRRDPPLPLVRWRAQGWVTDVRLADLQFTVAEAKAFLERAVAVSPSPAALAAVHDVMEGWPVGLRLLALVLRHQAEPEAYLAGLRGGIQETRDYLLQEVLGRLSAREREWVLKTAILDRFCAPLCDAVCGAGAAAGAPFDGVAFLAWLERDGLFVIPLDPELGWSRYHHLFQQVLRAELERREGRETVAALHVRAAEWFEAEGLIDEAIRHALAAEDVERAAQLVERHIDAALDADRWYDLERWLARLPGPVTRDRAVLLLGQAWVLWFRQRLEPLVPILDRSEQLLRDDPDQGAHRGDLAFFRGVLCLFQGDGPRSQEYLEEALERIPRSHGMRRGEVGVLLGVAVQVTSGKELALNGLGDLLDADPPPISRTRAALLVTMVYVHLLSGDVGEAASWNRRFADAGREHDLTVVAAWSEYLSGLMHVYEGQVDAAIRHLQRAVEHRFIYETRAAIDGLVALMLANQASGRSEEARTVLAMLQGFVAFLGDPGSAVLADAAEARLGLLRGESESARTWLERGTPPPFELMLFWLEVPCVTWCRALIAEGSAASLRDAEGRLREYAAVNETQHNTCQLIGIQSLLALACERQGKTDDALGALERAVTLARAGGVVFPFVELGAPMAGLLRQLGQRGVVVDDVARLLAAFDPAVPVAVGSAPGARPIIRARSGEQAVVASLTNREVEVLELLVERLYNKEIADRLHISQETVKAHLKSVYAKLGVSSRRQAALRAGELAIVGANQGGTA